MDPESHCRMGPIDSRSPGPRARRPGRARSTPAVAAGRAWGRPGARPAVSVIVEYSSCDAPRGQIAHDSRSSQGSATPARRSRGGREGFPARRVRASRRAPSTRARPPRPQWPDVIWRGRIPAGYDPDRNARVSTQGIRASYRGHGIPILAASQPETARPTTRHARLAQGFLDEKRSAKDPFFRSLTTLFSRSPRNPTRRPGGCQKNQALSRMKSRAPLVRTA